MSCCKEHVLALQMSCSGGCESGWGQYCRGHAALLALSGQASRHGVITDVHGVKQVSTLMVVAKLTSRRMFQMGQGLASLSCSCMCTLYCNSASGLKCKIAANFRRHTSAEGLASSLFWTVVVLIVTALVRSKLEAPTLHAFQQWQGNSWGKVQGIWDADLR